MLVICECFTTKYNILSFKFIIENGHQNSRLSYQPRVPFQTEGKKGWEGYWMVKLPQH